jgi:O-antigen ligase
MNALSALHQPAPGGVALAIRDAGTGGPVRPAPAAALRHARERNGVAKAAIALGIAGLPILRPTVAGNLGPADAAILFGVGGTLLWAGGTKQVLKGAYLLPLALMVLSGLVSGLAGAQPSAALLAVAQDVYLVLWAMACLNVSRDGDAAGFVARAWCATAFVWAVTLFFVVGRSALSASNGDTRLAFTADTNGAGLYFVLSIFVMIAARRPRRRLWRWTAIAFLAADTVLTGSLGALSGLFAGLAVAVMLDVFARRGPAPALALILAMGLAAASGTLFAQRYRVVDSAHASSNPIVRNSLGRGAQSSTERSALTKETLGLVSRVSVLGGGPNTTEQLLRDEQAPYPKQAHNDWIAALVERGILGLAAVALLGMEVARRTAAARDPARLRRSYADTFPASHYLVGGVVTVAIFSLTHEVLHDRTAWTLLGIIAAISVFGRRTQQTPGGL